MTSIPAAICRTYSNNFKRHYLKNKRLFRDFFLRFCIYAWNLEHFQKKYEYPSLMITEIIYAERPGYLNVWKVLLQNTIR